MAPQTQPSREIINVQVGQAGNQVGETFWNMLLAEHGLDEQGMYKGSDDLQLARAGVYFSEVEGVGSRSSKFVPRSVQIDLEAGLRSGPLGNLFRPDTFITGESGAGNNWAKGFYTEGAELIDSIFDVLRKQAESCDSLQGFQIVHSLGGGTGAGLGSLLLSKIREEFPDRMLSTFSIIPSVKVSETIVEPYNAMLSLHQLVDNGDLTFCIDNEALYDINTKTLKIAGPTFRHLNDLIARVMCGISTSLRFPGQLNGDLRKLGMNLVPFPRLHFLMPSYAPFYNSQSKAFERFSVPELTKAYALDFQPCQGQLNFFDSLFDRKNLLVACSPEHGRYLTAATIFRGKISSREVSAEFMSKGPDDIRCLAGRNKELFALCRVGLAFDSATGLSNSTAIQEVFKRTSETYQEATVEDDVEEEVEEAAE
ncbi:Tubulin beta-2 chain [Termitomyces sp. Mi166|nr:Tubulin beta-2 chain [Termitomyces sp. Mi166\